VRGSISHATEWLRDLDIDVAAMSQQHVNTSRVLLIDGNVKGTALAAVDHVHLGSRLQQDTHHLFLVTATAQPSQQQHQHQSPRKHILLTYTLPRYKEMDDIVDVAGGVVRWLGCQVSGRQTFPTCARSTADRWPLCASTVCYGSPSATLSQTAHRKTANRKSENIFR